MADLPDRHLPHSGQQADMLGLCSRLMCARREERRAYTFSQYWHRCSPSTSFSILSRVDCLDFPLMLMKGL